MQYYYIIKSIHIIFIVSYFAGLFYMVRLFIYHTESKEKSTEEQKILSDQYKVMERKLWNIITVPALIIVIASGVSMLILNSELIQQPWMHIKLTFILLLLAYHLWTWNTLKKLQKGIYTYSSIRLRMLNEVATLLLFIIVFAAVLKNTFINNWHWILISFVLVGILIMSIVRLVNGKK